MKKVLATMLALMMVLAVTAQAASFTDMEGHWSDSYVQELSGLGIVRGYEDGTFKPENTITNQEAFTLFARVIGVNDEKNAQAVAYAQELYASVAENYQTYAVKELCFMLYRGVLTTDDLDTYLSEDRKQEPMKRHEAAKLITKILNGEDEVANAVMFVFDYTDADTFPNEAKGYIDFVTKKGIMSGMGDNTFSPNTGVTRGQVTVMLKRTMEMLDLSYISGTATEVSGSGLTVNGESFAIPATAAIHRDGEAVAADEIENGDYVTIVKTYQGILAIDAAETEESESNVKMVEGIYRGSFTDSRGTFIKVYDKEGGVNTTESYILSEGTVTYTVNGEKRASLTAISETDYVYVTFVGGKVVHIDAETKTKQIDGAAVVGMEHEGETNILVFTNKGVEAKLPIAENITVKRNGKEATINNLLAGDSINLTVNYGEITAIAATSKTSTVNGTITAIHIEKEMPYITIKISETNTKTIYLTMDTKINIDDKSGDIYDLVLGYNVKVSTESDTASKITVTSVATQNNVTGTVVLVNPQRGFINVSMIDPATGEIVTKQIFVTEKTSIRAGSNAAIVKLEALAEGDSVFAVGVEKIGTFEATSIMVVNK